MKLIDTIIKLQILLIFNLLIVGCSEEPADDSSDPDSGNQKGIVTKGAEAKSFTATLHGAVTAKGVPDYMGFEYSYDKSFPDEYTESVVMEGKIGDFSLEIKGLTDLKTVYYRAAMSYGEEVIFGKTMSFKTAQGTYFIDGKEFKFIKVDDGPNGSFSMMQTELPPNAVLEIDGYEIGTLDMNGDGTVTKGEVREFLDITPILFRAPTAAEWYYAATGGMQSKGYTYSGSDNLDEVGWYQGNAQGSHRRPGQKKPNESGFYDMSGNYSEFVAAYSSDLLDMSREFANKFKSSVKDVTANYFNTTWAAVESPSRGGNWTCAANACTVKSTLSGLAPTNRFGNEKHTFRLVYSRPTIGEETSENPNVSIETLQAKPQAYMATLEGRVSGSTLPDEVGFEYSYSSDFKQRETAVVGMAGVTGRFSLDTNTLIDLCKVYFRAYARTDGVTQYGETKMFETTQGYYYLNGKKYKFIKVTGLKTGSFSMMQTELIPDGKFLIDSPVMTEASTIDQNGDGCITKGESREFLSLPFIFLRSPSVGEWKLAAKAGENFSYSGGNSIDEIAWYSGNSNARAHDEALKKPNALGFYDMSGNYDELCADYNDDQLLDMVIYIREMHSGLKSCPAEFFNNSWNATKAFGGYYNSAASECTIDSYTGYNGAPSSNRIDASRYTFRFVYSRPD